LAEIKKGLESNPFLDFQKDVSMPSLYTCIRLTTLGHKWRIDPPENPPTLGNFDQELELAGFINSQLEGLEVHDLLHRTYSIRERDLQPLYPVLKETDCHSMAKTELRTCKKSAEVGPRNSARIAD
jgi:hypothetical protein